MTTRGRDIQAGKLGTACTLSLDGGETTLYGVLTASCTLTLTRVVPGSRLRVMLTQDGHAPVGTYWGVALATGSALRVVLNPAVASGRDPAPGDYEFEVEAPQSGNGLYLRVPGTRTRVI